MRFCLVAALLLSLGCGDEETLTVRGSVEVDAAGTVTGFEFVETTRLVDPYAGERSETAIAGTCTLRTDGAVVVSLQAPGDPPEGVGLHRVGLEIWEGRQVVHAQLGTVEYGAEGGGGCTTEILYREDDDGSAGVSVACGLTTGPGGETAELSAELHFGGCSVRGFPSR